MGVTSIVVDTAYLVFTSGQSGSTYLRQLLYSYGLGSPKEPRNIDGPERFIQSQTFTRSDGTSIFSVKVKHGLVHNMPVGMMCVPPERNNPNAESLELRFDAIPEPEVYLFSASKQDRSCDQLLLYKKNRYQFLIR